ncbi:MAG: hypothetical protein QOF83_2389 [Solirubrobacteraceae bacterium]|jgi:hypothetical protein|nr:hypothetical protein [Solirubrobacteraceae bacterium]
MGAQSHPLPQVTAVLWTDLYLAHLRTARSSPDRVSERSDRLGDPVGQRPDTVDLDLDGVAGV